MSGPTRPAAGGRSRGQRRRRRAEAAIGMVLMAAMAAGLGLMVTYALGGQTQVEGVFLAVALGGIGAAIALWAIALLPDRLRVEARHPLRTDPGQLAALPPPEPVNLGRRHFLAAALVGAIGTLAAALALPVLSLGPAPGRSLFQTAWRRGASLAVAGGDPVRVDDLPVGGVLTVFPDGDASDPNAATLLLRVDPALLAAGTDQGTGAEGILAFSKICTHAGCPVGLYRAIQHTLICPCHQSQFDVLRDAHPISGPAARPLPRLPIRQRADGTFEALGDFPEPVGPSFWNVHG